MARLHTKCLKGCGDTTGTASRNLLNVGKWVQRAAWFAVACGLACSGQNVKDPDHDQKKEFARAFSIGGPTKDHLNEAIGDKEDWRFWEAEATAKAELRVGVSKWEDSVTLNAIVTVYDQTGKVLVEKPMSQSNLSMREQFDAELGLKYFVRFKLNSGKGEYLAECGPPLDPCAACTDKQECKEAKCVEKPCGGSCPDGTRCDAGKGECVKVKVAPENKCEGVSCPKGEVCFKHSGKCGVVPVKQPGEEPEKKDSNIDCDVIDARDSGAGSVLTLSAGENKGVKKGMSGFVKGAKGATFTVVDVYPSRSKASCKVPAAKLAGQTKAQIKP